MVFGRRLHFPYFTPFYQAIAKHSLRDLAKHFKRAIALHKTLDDQLQSVGAKFDICDTVTLDELEEMSLTEVLMNAITD